MTSVKPVDHTLSKTTGRTGGVVHHGLDIVVSAAVSNAIYIAVYGAAHVAAHDEIKTAIRKETVRP